MGRTSPRWDGPGTGGGGRGEGHPRGPITSVRFGLCFPPFRSVPPPLLATVDGLIAVISERRSPRPPTLPEKIASVRPRVRCAGSSGVDPAGACPGTTSRPARWSSTTSASPCPEDPRGGGLDRGCPVRGGGLDSHCGSHHHPHPPPRASVPRRTLGTGCVHQHIFSPFYPIICLVR